METLRQMLSPDFLLRNSVYTSVLIGFACPLVGVFLVVRRLVFIGVALPQISSTGVAVALDHAGFPDLPLTDDARVLGLAEIPDVHLKVSSHLLEAAPDPGAVLSRLADAFGAGRLCWGSDYPQTSTDYGALLRLGREAAAAFPHADREAFLSGTATRLFPVPG